MIKNIMFAAAVLSVVLLAVTSSGCKAKDASKPENNEIIEVKDAAQATVAAASPEELFKQTCSHCHILGKAISYSGETPWKEIVDRMIIHNAKITPENAAVIVKHLETTYPLKKAETI